MEGIQGIRDIPPYFQCLTANQRRVWNSIVTGRSYVSPDLGNVLSKARYPLHFLDIETFNSPLPIFPGAHPYQVRPFQWSSHVRARDGKLRHTSFLHHGMEDPREAFSRSLSNAIGPKGTIFVYSSYEQVIIGQLASTFPQYESWLLALTDRFSDLLAVVRANFYHPGFHHSYSIKAVLPTLVPDMTYSDLEIRDGSVTSAYFSRTIVLDTGQAERDRIWSALVDYCERDTLAILQILDALLSMSRSTA